MKKIKFNLIINMCIMLQLAGCDVFDSDHTCESPQLVETLTINPVGAIDTRGADQYFIISDILLQDSEPTSVEWDSLFATPYYDILINQNKASTQAKEKEDLRITYMPSRASEIPANADRLQQHLNYKDNSADLKAYLIYLKSIQVIDSVTHFLYPFLPARLQQTDVFPSLVYTYYYDVQANGIPSGIIQDLSLCALVDNYRMGIVTAHEAYHSIVTKEYESRLNPQVTCSDSRTTLLRLIINPIAQEGIADLIDKDILIQPGSPVRDYILPTLTDEFNLSVAMIHNLDNELKYAGQTGTLKINFNNVNGVLIKFGGHIPGRIMGKTILQYGKLPDLLDHIENPFRFFYIYNEAAAMSEGDLPLFSQESIDYLKQIEAYLILP